MIPATPDYQTAHSAGMTTPITTADEPGNVVPLKLDVYVNNSNTPLHASPHRLRVVRRELVDDLRRYVRTSKDEIAKRMLTKLKGCGETPIGRGVSLVRHTIDGKTVGGTVQGVKTCKDRSCPVCAARIEGTEARETRASLVYLHHTGTLEQTRLVLFTATLRHSFHDDHRKNFQTLLAVLAKLQTQRWWKAAITGSIVKLEIEGTLTDARKAGLHPHAHILLALARGVDSSKLADRVRDFFKAEFENHYPGESRIGWQNPKEETWWKPVTTDNLPFYLAKKRWSIAEEVTASGAKNGGFWERPIEDLVAVWGLMEGVRSIRRTGIFRKALAAVRDLQEKPQAVPIARMTNAAWSALSPEVREALSAALENPAADPAWIAWTVANMHDMSIATQEAFLGLLANSRCPSQVIPSLIAAAPQLSQDQFFELLVETLRLARSA